MAKSKKTTKKSAAKTSKPAMKAGKKAAPKKATKKVAAKKATKKVAAKASAPKKTTAKKAAPKKSAAKAAPKKTSAPKKAAAPKAAAASAEKSGSKGIPKVALQPTVVTAKVQAADEPAHHAPKIGDDVSDFALPSTDGEFRLSTQKGKKVVLYFYPKDATPGCTLEGHDFSKLKNDFAAAGAVVMGVSRDDMKSHEKFKAKEGYSVDLIADTDETLCQMFDVIQMKNMYGKNVLGVVRSTFLIDENGKLAKEWRKVSVPGHAAEVLESVKAL